MCMQALLSTDLQLQGVSSGGSAATSSASTRGGWHFTATELADDQNFRKLGWSVRVGLARSTLPTPFKLDLACSCAVKVLSVVSNQGVENSRMKRLLGELRHQNLMPLLGCCEEMGHEALVFPLKKGGDFFDRLHCRKSACSCMTILSLLSWTRYYVRRSIGSSGCTSSAMRCAVSTTFTK